MSIRSRNDAIIAITVAMMLRQIQLLHCTIGTFYLALTEHIPVWQEVQHNRDQCEIHLIIYYCSIVLYKRVG